MAPVALVGGTLPCGRLLPCGAYAADAARAARVAAAENRDIVQLGEYLPCKQKVAGS